MMKEHALFPTTLKPGDWAVCRYSIGQVGTVVKFDNRFEVETMVFDHHGRGKMAQGLRVFPLTLETLDITRFFQSSKHQLVSHPASKIINWHEAEEYIAKLFDSACLEGHGGVRGQNDVHRFVREMIAFLDTLVKKTISGVHVVSNPGLF